MEPHPVTQNRLNVPWCCAFVLQVNKPWHQGVSDKEYGCLWLDGT